MAMLQVVQAVQEMVASAKWRSAVGVMKGLLEQPEMRMLLVAGAETVSGLLWYVLWVAKVGTAILQMVQMAVMGVHA